jgi:AcrR family transcriptional regulator
MEAGVPKLARDARVLILAAAYKLFYRRGYSRVGVDEIAEAAGVTKRTLYYHFASKDDLLAAVLEDQRPLALSSVRKLRFFGERDADAAIDALGAELRRWFGSPHWSGSGFTRIAMELGDLPGHPARKIASVHKTEVEATYAEFFAALGIANSSLRAREFVVLLEGALVLTLIHGKPDYAETALTILRERIKSSEPH